MGITLLVVAVGAGCFGAGVVWRNQTVNAANEARLEAQRVLSSAKNEYQKLKSGLKHDLDLFLG